MAFQGEDTCKASMDVETKQNTSRTDQKIIQYSYMDANYKIRVLLFGESMVGKQVLFEGI